MPVLIVVMLGLRSLVCGLRLRLVTQLATAAIIAALFVAPILLRNVTQYNAWAFTPQGGAHLAFWVVPLVKEAKDGTVWSEGAKQMQQRRDARFGAETGNPFEESRKLSTIGREALQELGLFPLVKAWTLGAALNLGTPAVVISPPVFQLPRTGFFATTGSSLIEKIFNFLFQSDNAAYAWILLIGLSGVCLIRLVQLFGLAALLQDRSTWPILTVFVLWGCYVLAINGPIASPKYRLPIEPVLMVLTGAGLVAIGECWSRRRKKNQN
jgi:hypothetical protein